MVGSLFGRAHMGSAGEIAVLSVSHTGGIARARFAVGESSVFRLGVAKESGRIAVFKIICKETVENKNKVGGEGVPFCPRDTWL